MYTVLDYTSNGEQIEDDDQDPDVAAYGDGAGKHLKDMSKRKTETATQAQTRAPMVEDAVSLR